ncbi:MAG: autotransporter domain-containing protein [Pseudomonadota bacterium]
MIIEYFGRALWCSTALALLQSAPLMAADITIPTGVTETTTQTIDEDGDTLLVESGGTIDTRPANGVAALGTADNQSLINNGLIEGATNGIRANGGNARITNNESVRGGSNGIRADGDDATVLNSGTVTSTTLHGVRSSGARANIRNEGVIDANVHGVRSSGEDAVITNTGTINAGVNGILSLDTGAMIVNTGTIEAQNNGIRANADDVVITNNGTIETATADGIRSSGANARITNNQTILGFNNGIRSDGDDAIITNTGALASSTLHGIRSTGANSVIVNSGTINGNVHGIRSSGDASSLSNTGRISGASSGVAVFSGQDITVTNSGRIAGGNFSVFFAPSAVNPTLRLQSGSVLEGVVDFGSASTLSVGEGLNLSLDYEGNAPTVVSDVPFVHDTENGVVYTVDPTGLALNETFVQVTANAVHEVVRDATANARAQQAGQPDTTRFAFAPNSANTNNAGKRRWVSGFGGYASQDGTGDVTGADQTYGGIVGGIDLDTGNHAYGAFAGGSYSRIESDNDTQEVDATSVFAGLYLDRQYGAYWLNAAAMIGYTQFSSVRTVANNLASDGLETASADYNGYFISPSVTVGRSIGNRVQASLGGYYAGLFMDSYDESGSAAGLDVDSRDVHVAAVRAELRYDAHQSTNKTGLMKVKTWGGVDGLFNLGSDDIDASIAGLPLSFSASFADSAAVGFVGLGVTQSTTDGRLYINASLEGRYGTDDYSEVRANIATILRF